MKNIISQASCESFPRFRKVRVLGKELELKNNNCSRDGIHYEAKPDPIKMQLTICPTSYCAAYCPFCIAKNTDSRDRLDPGMLEKVLRALKEQQIVRGVSLMGGEPFTDMALLDEVVSMIFEILGMDTEISVTTNGINLHRIHEITHLPRIDAIHVSRHHYDDDINRRFFGIDVPSAAQLKEIMRSVVYRDIFVFNCLLMKDYIGTPEQAHKFMDFAIETGAKKVAFITCIPINAFAAAQTLPYAEILRKEDENLLFTRGFWDYEFCHCQDGVYVSPEGRLIEFYGRQPGTAQCSYCRGFVYGADNHLRTGYDGEIII